MGYSIECHDSRFQISKPKAALAALKEANRRRALFSFEEIPVEIEAAKTVSDAIRACCWDIEEDENGNVAALFYEGKLLTTLGDVERLFGILAPFVKPGSYLVIQGEEGACYRYVFKKGKLRVEQEDADD